MSSSYISNCLVSVSILAVVLAMHIHSVMCLNQTNAYLQHICINSEGKYKSEIAHETRIKELIESLSKSLDSGFINGGDGDGPGGMDDINVKFQCRGDVPKSMCRFCLYTAFGEIVKKCPKNKRRIIWYDHCFLDLSSNATTGTIDNKHSFYMYNAKEVSGGDTKSFNENTKALLYKLKEEASRKEQKPFKKHFMFATGEESLGTKKLYAMVQCTQDLLVQNCSVCLDGIMSKLPRCCNAKQGGRVLNPNCNFRYELYPFVRTQPNS